VARFVERADADYLTGQETVEQLGAYLATTYQRAETHLLAEIARRVAADMNTADQTARLAAIQSLRVEAARTIAAIDSEALARVVVETAMREGEAAAIEQLGFTQAAGGATNPIKFGNGVTLPFATGITPGAALASAQIGLELTNALDDMSARILRFTPDVYQQTVARFAGERLLGATTGRQAQNRAVASFLSKGITGFVDQGGRRWSVSAYTEMATRTATNRAWLAGHTERWDAMGLQFVTIVRGSDSCQACARWSGRVLSLNGITGTVEAEHATTGAPVTVEVAGTIESARADGWNHPNCRCTLAPVFPGLSLPANDSTYDPQSEKDRDRLRYLERRVRTLKQKQNIAGGLGDEFSASQYGRSIRAEQARIRDHVANTGQIRKPYREALSFSAGGPTSTPSVAPAAIAR